MFKTPADELVLVGVKLFNDRVIDQHDPLGVLYLHDKSFDESPPGLRSKLLTSQGAGDLVMAQVPFQQSGEVWVGGLTN